MSRCNCGPVAAPLSNVPLHDWPGSPHHVDPRRTLPRNSLHERDQMALRGGLWMNFRYTVTRDRLTLALLLSAAVLSIGACGGSGASSVDTVAGVNSPSTPGRSPSAAPSGTAAAYEAESGVIGGGADIQSVASASGGLVVGHMVDAGAFAQVTADGGTGGAATLVVRFANAYSSQSSLSLYVNGVRQRQVAFASTGDWNTFGQSEPIALTLVPGSNVLRLQRDGVDVNATDIDRLEVTAGTVAALAPTPAPAQPLPPTPLPAPLPAPAPVPIPPPVLAPDAIANLGVGQWLELPNTKIRSVWPGTGGDALSIVTGWSGGTVDTTRGRLLVWGGGHNDYAGNEMYALDLASMSIQRVIEQSPQIGAANCSTALPDGTPAARHTYDGMAYIAHADRFFAIGGSLSRCGYADGTTWTYDFGAKKWTMSDKKNVGAAFGIMAEYDPATKLVFVNNTGGFYAYNFDTDTYTALGGLSVDYHLTATIDTKRRKFVMMGTDGVKVIDLSTYRMTTMATTNTPSLVNDASPGVAYDPVADRIVAWSGGSNVYALNMDTGVWTQVATGAGPTAAAVSQGTFGRWAYIPGYRVFALINGIDQNAWVFRLAK